MINKSYNPITRRRFLTNSAALGTVLGLGTVAGTLSTQSAFAASEKSHASATGCAQKHADIAADLRQMLQDEHVDSTAMSYALKTSHCSDCGTMISAGMQHTV